MTTTFDLRPWQMTFLISIATSAACGPIAGSKAPSAPDTSKPSVALDTSATEIPGDDGEDGEDDALAEDDDEQADAANDEDDDGDGDGDAENDDDEDEDEDEDDQNRDDEDASSHREDLFVTVQERADEGTILKVRPANSTSWSSLTLADDGSSSTISGICLTGGKETKIEVAFQNDETGEVRVGSANVLVTGSGSSTLTIAFDDESEGPPDDNILTLRCGSGTLQAR